MSSSSHTARLDVDLSALLANYHALQSLASGAAIAPVVKADAYGLGAARIASWLAKHGAETFFVARLDEGIVLRRVLPDVIIYVLDGLTEAASFYTSHDLRPVLNTPGQAAAWTGGPAGLHIDTGMNRLGLRADEIAALPSGFTPALLISHLACADERENPMNARQLAAFSAVAERFPGVPKSFANSAGAFLGQAYHFDILRPGISLYGGGPFGTAHPAIRPVATVTARVLQVRDLKAGETVGYGASFTAPADMRLATVGIGYADGLLRSFAAGGFATIKGERRRLTGRISMDAFSMDVTGLEVTTDDWGEILGLHQNLDEVAAISGTIGYEWLTRLGARLPRHYAT